MRQWWKDLNVSTKLYAVFGSMACLILIEFMVLAFSMSSLSALRAFVEGEALWSKAQKNAIHALNQYALTLDQKYFEEFRAHIMITEGDHIARMELAKDNPDYETMRMGLLQGGNHEDDVDGVIQLLERAQNISYVREALQVWQKGDDLVQELKTAGHELHTIIQKRGSEAAVNLQLVRIGQINADLTKLEVRFSHSLGEGSRWLEKVLFYSLLTTALSVMFASFTLTHSFSRHIGRNLRYINEAAAHVGSGDFNFSLPVESKDELGQLSQSMNAMVQALKKTESERQLAESANQSKSLFLANVSHELRTPLGVIMGYTELLKDKNTSCEDRQNYVNIIDQTGQNLARIVNDILDLSKIEAGHFDLKAVEFSFGDLVSEIHGMFDLKARDRQTGLHFHIQTPKHLEIRTDRDRLRQMFVNLLSNALKFTESGRIDVYLELKKSVLSIRVKDTGIGIPADKQELLFRQFSRVQAIGQESVEGAGLGLALSRSLARKLGGDIALLQSQVGSGSEFELQLPVEIKSVGISHKPTLQTDFLDLEVLRGKKVLVVDDAPENQMLVRLFLTKEGMLVDTASDGEEAVRTASAHDYDVVLMDMQMPVMNGYDAVKTLRDRGFERPIVAFTASAMKGDEERCFEVGCNAFVAKPVKQRLLLKSLADLV